MVDFKRRKVAQAISAALAIPFLSACGGGSDSSLAESDSAPGDGASPGTTGRFYIYPNASDPRIIGGPVDEGDDEQFVLYGEKDADGNVISASEMYFMGPAPAFKTASAKYIPGEKKYVGLSDDVQVELAEDGNGGLNFGLITSGQQLSINLPAPTAGGGASTKSVRPARSRLGQASVLTLTGDACPCDADTDAVSRRRSTSAGGAILPLAEVRVKGCVGQNPTVKVMMRDETGKHLDVLFGKPDPAGHYNVVVPYINTPTQALEKAGQQVLDFTDSIGVSDDAFSSIVNVLLGKTKDSLANDVVEYLESRWGRCWVS